MACPSLKKGELALPKTLCQIAPGALDQAHGLTSFRVDPEHSTLCSLEGLIYTKDKEKLIGCPAGKVGTITVAAETNAIAEVALNGCPYVTEYRQ